MILQALTRYYDILSNDPDCPIARKGYSTVPVSFALVLSAQGALKGIVPLTQTQQNGNRTVEVPRRMVVPERAVRTVGVKANFMCDTSAYVMGISEKDAENPKYAKQRFEDFCKLHFEILTNADCPEARALLAFLNSYDPSKAGEDGIITAHREDLLKGGNLVFQLEGSSSFAHEAPAIRQAWEAYKNASEGSKMGQCLVTGEWTAIARLHPNLKGVRDAQPSGATLVGFNAPAYESYNRAKEQGWNAPTGERAAFAYTTVLNYMLSRESDTPKFTLGDATVVYWAESSNRAYTDVFATMFNPDWVAMQDSAMQRNTLANRRLQDIAEKVRMGAPLDANGLLEGLDPDTRFYVLGLAPNAARVSVRFFYGDAFQKMIARIMAHYDDMQIVRTSEKQPARIPIHRVLGETVSKKATDKSPSPLMAGAVLRAVLTNQPYPAALYNAILTRIRADADDDKLHIVKIGYTRAAIIKAYLTRKYRNQPLSQIQEVLCMALNEQSTHPAYLLGRLFAVLEKVQAEAIGDVNATIKDRYFTSACAAPATVFPVLLRLAQHHVAKAEYGYASDRRIQDILNLLEMDANPIPRRLSLDEQGIFVLGYYHQRAAFYTPGKTAAVNNL